MKNKSVVALMLSFAMILTACNAGSKKEESKKKTKSKTKTEMTSEDVLEDESDVASMDTMADTSETTKKSVPSTWTYSGDYIVFGHYEQDGDTSNGPEPIEWEIVSKEDGKMLLVSRYILDSQPYNIELENVSWETCSLRAWLNDDFYNTAFSEEEQVQILTTHLDNYDDFGQGDASGKDTDDKVFCLRNEEVGDHRFAELSEYAKSLRVLQLRGYGKWWLRSPGFKNSTHAVVVGYGTVDSSKTEVGILAVGVNADCMGVRPAICLSEE